MSSPPHGHAVFLRLVSGRITAILPQPRVRFPIGGIRWALKASDYRRSQFNLNHTAVSGVLPLGSPFDSVLCTSDCTASSRRSSPA